VEHLLAWLQVARLSALLQVERPLARLQVAHPLARRGLLAVVAYLFHLGCAPLRL
jgi:hypothetical protein